MKFDLNASTKGRFTVEVKRDGEVVSTHSQSNLLTQFYLDNVVKVNSGSQTNIAVRYLSYGDGEHPSPTPSITSLASSKGRVTSPSTTGTQWAEDVSGGTSTKTVNYKFDIPPQGSPWTFKEVGLDSTYYKLLTYALVQPAVEVEGIEEVSVTYELSITVPTTLSYPTLEVGDGIGGVYDTVSVDMELQPATSATWFRNLASTGMTGPKDESSGSMASSNQRVQPEASLNGKLHTIDRLPSSSVMYSVTISPYLELFDTQTKEIAIDWTVVDGNA